MDYFLSWFMIALPCHTGHQLSFSRIGDLFRWAFAPEGRRLGACQWRLWQKVEILTRSIRGASVGCLRLCSFRGRKDSEADAIG